jgi:hypothetical protein
MPNNIFGETGVTGLRRAGGYVQEEFLPQLSGYRAIQVYREMKDNDPVVGAILYAIDKLIRQVSWRVQPASTALDDQKAAKFLESCLHDMSTSWEDTVSEIMSMLPYGFSLHEIVYKRRDGDKGEGGNSSRYDDKAIGWRKLPIRAQETRQEWTFDDQGGIRGMIQSAPPDYTAVTIPIEKALLFRTTTFKNNPEGRSVLRNAYRPWYFKKRIEEIESIGIERDLAGFPVMYVDPEIMRADANSAKQTVFQDYKDAVINIRRDQQEGMILPSIFDDNGNALYRFELISSGGTRQFDTSSIIMRYDQRIATTVLADFILLGQSAYGSYALSTDKTNLFALSLRAWLETIKNVMNQYAVPRLFRVNGFSMKKLPELMYGDVETPPLTEIGTFIQQLAGAGAPLFPDGVLENHLRAMAHLPERREEARGDVAGAGAQQMADQAAAQGQQPSAGSQPQLDPKQQAQAQAEAIYPVDGPPESDGEIAADLDGEYEDDD